MTVAFILKKLVSNEKITAKKVDYIKTSQSSYHPLMVSYIVVK